MDTLVLSAYGTLKRLEAKNQLQGHTEAVPSAMSR
ncbi:hypothetical protein BH23GEM3_BH23GEM3_03500 [soil metagenome]